MNYLVNIAKKSGLLIACLLLFMAAKAQKDTSEIYNESVKVAREYIPKLTDAVKLDVIPVNEKMEIKKPEITYTAKSPLVKVETTNNTKLPAVTLIKSQKQDFQHLMLKGGFGNYSNILFEADYNTTKLTDKAFTVHALHNSGKSTIKVSNAIEQLIEIGGQKDFGEKSFKGNIFLENDRYHFFGYNPDSIIDFDTIDPLTIRQNFLTTGFKASFTNELTKNDKIKYWFGAGLYNMMDYYRKNELGINVSGEIEQYFNGNPIRFEAIIDHYIYNTSPTIHRTLFNIKASYVYLRENWKAEIGFEAPTETDTLETKTHFYPQLLIDGKIVEGYFHGFAGITGGHIQNTYRSMTLENPFIVSDYQLRNTNNKFEIFGGFKGSAGDKFRYFTKFSYHNIENQLLYVNDSTDSKRFLTIFDSSNINLIKLEAEISFAPINNLVFHLNTAYNKYDQNTNEPYPWHMPIFEFKAKGQYSIQNKISLNVEYYYIGKRYAKDWTNPTVPIDLKPINDLNAGVLYKFSDRWAAYFQFNNILNSSYSYYNNYELRAFHFLVGAKANL